MKQKNMTIYFKDSETIHIDGEVTVAMDPLGFYVIKADGKLYGFNSELVASYEYEYEEYDGPKALGDNVHSLQ